MRAHVAPSRLQRWVADHRTGVKIGSYLYLMVAVVLGVARWSESGWTGLLLGALLLPGGIAWVLNVGQVSTFVDDWDRKERTT